MKSAENSVLIGLLAYPGAQASALHGLSEFFSVATENRPSESVPALVPQIVELDDTLVASLPLEKAFHVIICPPRLQNAPPRVSASQISWLQAQHKAGCVMCSVCAGVLILAQAGLLDGRQATTHWQLSDGFQQQFPQVNFKPDQILIDNGDIITAGGVMAWVDMGLHLIERFHSPTLMLSIARQFVVESGKREQRYFSSFQPKLSHGDQAILRVQHFLQKSLSDSHTLHSMADLAGLSERTFGRRFKLLTGMTPLSYLHHVKVEEARKRLELSSDSFGEIAWAVGYKDTEAFRNVFLRIVGLGPKEYRSRFGITNRHR